MKPQAAHGAIGGDSLGVYFDQISDIPLLTREQEIDIAKDMDDGRFEVRNAATRTPLAARYVIALADRLSRGQIAIETLVTPPQDRGAGLEPKAQSANFRKRARQIAKFLKRYEALEPSKNTKTAVEDSRSALLNRIGGAIEKCDLSEKHIDHICAKLKEALQCIQHVDRRRQGSKATIIADACAFTGISIPELRVVVSAIEAGRQRAGAAKDRLVLANLRLVVTIAKQYRAGSLTLGDLVQEGNVGLMRAADGFDWRRGFKFSTYAKWWIRSFVFDCIESQAPVVRIPKHMRDTKSRIRQAANLLREDLERAPSIDEIAALSGLSAAKIKVAIASENESYSLDAPVGDEPSDAPLSERIGDPRLLAPEDSIEFATLQNHIDRRLELLDDRIGEIIAMRFGMGESEPKKLREVGNCFDISRERVRQIENTALRRLRTTNCARRATETPAGKLKKQQTS